MAHSRGGPHRSAFQRMSKCTGTRAGHGRRTAISAIIAATAIIPGKCTHHEFRNPLINMAATEKSYREGAKERSCAKEYNFDFFAKLRFFAPSR